MSKIHDGSYNAILVDTSIFEKNSINLEKGLLGKLNQFKKTSVTFLLPDVIYGEVKNHLDKKIRDSCSSLITAIRNASGLLLFDGSTIGEDIRLMLDSKKIENYAEMRLQRFIENTDAFVLPCGDYVSISELLGKYFSNAAPFSENGKKKNEFPDAIVLMAVDAWAKEHEKSVLAISADADWKKYCDSSKHIQCIEELSDGLASFNNKQNIFLRNLECALNANKAQFFLDRVSDELKIELGGFTPDQYVESRFFWEPEGCHGWFESFYLKSNELKVIECDEDYIVFDCKAVITVGAEGEFSLEGKNFHDSVTVATEKEFESEILITIYANFEEPIENLVIEEVEIVSPIKRIHFGTLEIDLND